MRKGPYRPVGRPRFPLREKAMPSPRRLKGLHYVPGRPGLINMHWVFKRLPKR